MKNYRIFCYWPSEVWVVLEQVEKDDHTTDWMEAHSCAAQGEAGYHEARLWIEKTKEKQ